MGGRGGSGVAKGIKLYTISYDLITTYWNGTSYTVAQSQESATGQLELNYFMEVNEFGYASFYKNLLGWRVTEINGELILIQYKQTIPWGNGWPFQLPRIENVRVTEISTATFSRIILDPDSYGN